MRQAPPGSWNYKESFIEKPAIRPLDIKSPGLFSRLVLRAVWTSSQPSKNKTVYAPVEPSNDAVRDKLPLADRVGIWLSFLCVIHCLLTPVLLLVFPALEAMKVAKLHESFHLVLLLILPIVAVIAFIPGYRRHRNRAVFYWAIPGLIVIAYVALFFEEAGWVATVISVSGSLLLIRAHSVNRRLCACCQAPKIR